MAGHLQANLYDSLQCDSASILQLTASPLALQLTGNAHLQHIPPHFMPQCAQLLVDDQPTQYHVTLQRPKPHQNQLAEVPYLQISAYLQETCMDKPDLQVSLLADGSAHPIGTMTQQQIQQLRQQVGAENEMQIQMIDESPVEVYYRASCEGEIILYAGKEAEQELLTVPLQKLMDVCYSPENPFPGLANNQQTREVRTPVHQLVRALLETQQTAQSEAVVRPHMKTLLADPLAVPAAMEEQVMPLVKHAVPPHRRHIDPAHTKRSREPLAHLKPDFSHFRKAMGSVNDHLEAREQQGLPIAFMVTCSTNVKVDPIAARPLEEEAEWEMPHMRRPCAMGPHEQAIAALVIGLLAALIVLRIITKRAAAKALEQQQRQQMQQAPAADVKAKKNGNYVAVASSPC